MDQLNEVHYFTSPVYMVKKEEFLDSVRGVSARYLEGAKGEVTVMTGTFMHEPEISGFAQYVSQTAWNILASQGYGVEKMVTYFTEMWTQEHRHMSVMECHVHPLSQITCLYFFDVPEKCGKLVIHDPRPGKVMSSLYQANPSEVSPASSQIVFTPLEGMLVFFNGWLPHSLTSNLSEEPFRFVHMNLSVAPTPEPTVEVV